MLAVGEWGVRRVVKAIVLVQNNMVCDKKQHPVSLLRTGCCFLLIKAKGVWWAWVGQSVADTIEQRLGVAD